MMDQQINYSTNTWAWLDADVIKEAIAFDPLKWLMEPKKEVSLEDVTGIKYLWKAILNLRSSLLSDAI